MSDVIVSNFIRDAVISDLESGRFQEIAVRFPPEPNGYLHIGHTKALFISWNISQEFNGKFNLRFDDTNPVKEDDEFVEGIKNDIHWLGIEFDNVLHTSDYFEQLYQWAIQLIEQGDAYVDELSAEAMREYRGTLTEAGKNSPWRDRPIAENLDLFKRMRQGEFAEGTKTLRAKIDMASPNINLRDPTMYRILHKTHHQTGDKWPIYPMYDWAHGQSDSIEGISHSLCSHEYVIHRPLYEWFLEKLGVFAPRQIEFGRLGITYTIMSKRKLAQLVAEGHVAGWDDPRMPTLAAMRRRGYPPQGLAKFVDSTGVSTGPGVVEFQQLEHFVRDHLNHETARVMAVTDPLKVVITNFPEGETDWVDAKNYPQDRENSETRKVPFTRELYIERADFAEEPPRKWKRMALGFEVRLMSGFFVTTTDVVKDQAGNIVEIHCTYDPETRGGAAPDRRRPKGTIHWVSAEHALPATFNLYDNLFSAEFPGNESGN
ncbi:MAG TPA: glutamine--tRNA ligase/YqeY domain fusion protein, partial [Anaerolineae bacterium]|nr:glutamine--tRNA ligase/YqeY domain fusion protein [Anaerolineae bacterium]